jgi:hypothetical protein
MGELIAKLQATAESECSELPNQHDERTALKVGLGAEKQELIDGKINRLDEQMTVDEEEDIEWSDPFEERTSTETELVDVTLQLQRAQQKNLGLQATAKAPVEAGQQEAAERSQAAFLAAERERDEAKSKNAGLEIRLAKLQEALLRTQGVTTQPAGAVAVEKLEELHLDFHATKDMLPPSDGNPTEEQKRP